MRLLVSQAPVTPRVLKGIYRYDILFGCNGESGGGPVRWRVFSTNSLSNISMALRVQVNKRMLMTAFPVTLRYGHLRYGTEVTRCVTGRVAQKSIGSGTKAHIEFEFWWTLCSDSRIYQLCRKVFPSTPLFLAESSGNALLDNIAVTACKKSDQDVTHWGHYKRGCRSQL